MALSRILASEAKQYINQQVKLMGWVHRLRKMGGVNFLLLRDRSGIVQVVLTEDEVHALKGSLAETVVEVVGTVTLADEAPNGVELHDNTVTPISHVTDAAPFALYKHRLGATLPVMLDHAVFANRSPERRAIFKLASGAMAGFRAALTSLDFVEIQTPKLVASATEGGANVFPVEYFGRTAYLAQSPQFYKQIMVGVFERVFEVGPVFRAEPHATSRHITEYVSLDAEFGFIRDHFDVMAVITTVLRGLFNHLHTHYAAELALLSVDLPTVPDSIPWVYFPDAQKMLHEQFGVTDALGEPDLTPEHERILGKWAQDTYASDFLFVTGYPMSKRPFYTHPNTADPAFSNSFDLLFRGTEMITGGQRLHCYEDYKAALRRQRLPEEPFKEYLEAFRYGMPPHGGFAIGLERLIMQLVKLDNIRLATLFPRDLNRLTP